MHVYINILVFFNFLISALATATTVTHSPRMSSSVNGTSSISTADFALKKIPNIAWKKRAERINTRLQVSLYISCSCLFCEKIRFHLVFFKKASYVSINKELRITLTSLQVNTSLIFKNFYIFV